MSHHRLAVPLAALALAGALLTGCSAADPTPTPTPFAAGGGSGGSTDAPGGEREAPAGGASALDQAAVDGMPPLPITECPQLDEYEYSPTSGNTLWRFLFTCTTRDAYDQTSAALVGSGYNATPLVISEGSTVSERTHLQADANGGSTEVQLNLTGSPEELEFEVYVILTLP